MSEVQASGSKQILLAEDEPPVLNLMQRLLHLWGYRVFSARNGREGMETADKHQDIALLVSDVNDARDERPRIGGKADGQKTRIESNSSLRILPCADCPGTRMEIRSKAI